MPEVPTSANSPETVLRTHRKLFPLADEQAGDIEGSGTKGPPDSNRILPNQAGYGSRFHQIRAERYLVLVFSRRVALLVAKYLRLCLVISASSPWGAFTCPKICGYSSSPLSLLINYRLDRDGHPPKLGIACHDNNRAIHSSSLQPFRNHCRSQLIAIPELGLEG